MKDLCRATPAKPASYDIFLKRKILQLLDDINHKTNISFLKMKRPFLHSPLLLGEPDYHPKYPTLQNL